jgi:hypothetical protein
MNLTRTSKEIYFHAWQIIKILLSYHCTKYKNLLCKKLNNIYEEHSVVKRQGAFCAGEWTDETWCLLKNIYHTKVKSTKKKALHHSCLISINIVTNFEMFFFQSFNIKIEKKIIWWNIHIQIINFQNAFCNFSLKNPT